MRSELGLASFYRDFIPNLAKIAEPIQKLMKKDVQFKWEEEQQQAFETIKKSISTKSCLNIPESDMIFQVKRRRCRWQRLRGEKCRDNNIYILDN